MLMSDQHNRRFMGCSGDRVARTPNLDRLAATGSRFTQAYCTNPVCTPSRASLLTGLYSHHIDAQNNMTPYSPERKTMAHHFAAAGYMTGLIGKMHWVDAQTHGFEYHLDFNDWFQFLGPRTQLYADELGRANSGSGLPQIDDLWRNEGDPWKGHRTLDSREGSVAVGDVSLLPEEDHFESFVARESNRFLKRFGTGEQPFFLISSFLKPHDPFMPAKRFADMFRWEDMQLPASWGKADLATLPQEVQKSIRFNAPTPELRDPVECKKRLALYYANLAQMDDALSQVMTTLRSLNLENDTIVCYTSDHGDMLGELGMWQKFEFYEGSCGIPLLLRLPGQKPSVIEEPVSLVNLCSTLTGLAGVPLMAPNDGRSMQPLLSGTQKNFGPVYAEYGLGGKQPKTMLREGDWKYTLWENDIPELYNLRSDPQELHNLAALPQYAERAAQMKAQIRSWQKLPAPYKHT
jgi:choline-sulfatase